MRLPPTLKMLALSVALCGAAGAQDGTLAGTVIENTASADFFDPSTSATATIGSNRVTTEVLAKPGFDILYRSGNDGLGSPTTVGNTPETASTLPGDQATGSVAPGGVLATPYTVVNNGNTVQTVSLTTLTGTNAPSVVYYADSNGDGILQDTERTPITSVSLPYDDPATTADEGQAFFFQVLPVPSGAAPGTAYSATPVGSGQGFDGAAPAPTTESASVLGLQYATATVANQPPVPADVTNAALTNTAGPTAISPLVATDDGSVSSFTIQTLPAPASGVLAYNGTPVTAGQVITDPTKLTFDPAPDFVGNATFDYAATDNLNLGSTTNKNADGTVTGGPATYTIPVQAPPSTDLQVQKTNTAPGTNGWTDLASDTVRLGASTFYWIRVINNGPLPVTGAVLTDQLLANGLVLGTTTCSSNGSTGTNLCTTTNKPTAAQLASGYTLPTIQPGQYFGFYVAVSVSTVPTGPTAGFITNTATVSIPSSAGLTDSNPNNNSASDTDRVLAPPIPNDATNPALPSSNGPTALTPNLSATDDGTVVSYKIDKLPDSASGVLLFNGNPVAVSQVIPANQLSLLTFDPAPFFSGTATFAYRATDNDNLDSTYHRTEAGAVISGAVATYSIPVVPGPVPQTPLTCQSTMYGLFGVDANPANNYYSVAVRPVTSAGTVGDIVAYIPSQYQNVAALALKPDGTKIYTSARLSDGTFVLLSYDVATSTWTNLGTFNTSTATSINTTPAYASRPVRMAIDANGNGYMSTSDYIWYFNANTGTLDPTPKQLVFDGRTTGLNPVPTLIDDFVNLKYLSGDFIADADGNIYLIANPEGVNYVDVYRISNLSSSAPVVSYISRLPHATTDTFTGMAALTDGIYAGANTGTVERINLGALTVTKTGQMSYTSSDLASCYYPTLRANVSSTKVVTDVTTGSTTTAKPGDTLEYTITIRNTGNITADGVTFQDTLPAGTTYVPGSTTTNGVSTPDTNGTFPYSAALAVKSPGTDVANGTTNAAISVSTDRDVVIKFRVTVNAGLTSVSNQGNVTYNTTTTGTSVQTTVKTDDPTPPGTQDPTVIGAGAPNLSVVKEVSSKVVRVTQSSAGDTLTLAPQQLAYTITVTNNGNATATNVVVSDTLPAGLTYVSASGTPALTNAPAVSGQQLSFKVDSLLPGAAQTINVVTNVAATPNATQKALTNTAQAQADTVAPVGSAPVVTEVLYPKLRKTVANLTRQTPAGLSADGTPGDELEYCLVFNNYSSVALPNFVLSDFVPGSTAANLSGYGDGLGIRVTRGAVTTYTSAADTDAGSLTSSGGDFGSGTLTLNLGTVSVGEEGQACFRVRIK